jgi:hypothetical protein
MLFFVSLFVSFVGVVWSMVWELYIYYILYNHFYQIKVVIWIGLIMQCDIYIDMDGVLTNFVRQCNLTCPDIISMYEDDKESFWHEVK